MKNQRMREERDARKKKKKIQFLNTRTFAANTKTASNTVPISCPTHLVNTASLGVCSLFAKRIHKFC